MCQWSVFAVGLWLSLTLRAYILPHQSRGVFTLSLHGYREQASFSVHLWRVAWVLLLRGRVEACFSGTTEAREINHPGQLYLLSLMNIATCSMLGLNGKVAMWCDITRTWFPHISRSVTLWCSHTSEVSGRQSPERRIPRMIIGCLRISVRRVQPRLQTSSIATLIYITSCLVCSVH